MDDNIVNLSSREQEVLSKYFPVNGKTRVVTNTTFFNLLRMEENEEIKIFDNWPKLSHEEVVELKKIHKITEEGKIFLKLHPSDDFQPHIIFDRDLKHRNWLIKSKSGIDMNTIFYQDNAIQRMLWSLDNDNEDKNKTILNVLIEFKHPVRFNRLESLFKNCFISGLLIDYSIAINLLLRPNFKVKGPFKLGEMRDYSIKRRKGDDIKEKLVLNEEENNPEEKKIDTDLIKKLEKLQNEFDNFKTHVMIENTMMLEEFKKKELKNVYERIKKLKEFIEKSF